MRILMLIDSFYPEIGGSETAVWRLSDTLSDLGHEVGVAVLSRPKAENPSRKFRFWNVPSRLRGIDAKFWGKIRNVRSIIQEFQPDIVNAHFLLESGYVGVRAAHAEGVPCVISIRGKGIFYRGNNLFEKLLYPFWIRGGLRADGFIATSQEMADIAHERHGISPRAVSNGVDINHFRPGRTDLNIRERHSIGPSQPILFCARRLVPKNGIEYIIRAFPAIRKQHDAVLLLASPKIREYERLKELVRSLRLQEVVHFLGPIEHDELPYYFCHADVVVQPSIAEARSLACLEAMASGAAVVATATGGLKELITHGESGYLVPSFEESTYQVGSVQEDGVANLVEAVCTLLSDNDLRSRIQNGARFYAETCSWPRIAEQTLQVYEQAIKQFSTHL